MCVLPSQFKILVLLNVIPIHGMFSETVDFGYISLHSKPLAAPPEIDGLVDVYDGMVALWGIKVGEFPAKLQMVYATVRPIECIYIYIMSTCWY